MPKLKSVVAPVNFLVPPGTPIRTGHSITYRVPIRDARPMIGQLSLDKQGFVLLHQRTAVTDFYDGEQIKTVYYPECERVMQAATGAARVVAFDHDVRNPTKAAVKGSGIKMPIKLVHNDCTAWSSSKRVRDLMGEEAEELLKHRFAILNLWRPIRGPLLDSPLALCDAQSLEEQNLIVTGLTYPDRTFETYAVTYNPNQRYYYFPKMQPDEALLIRCFDSALDGAARFCVHAGFDDPETPADAAPRESIELRAVVFFPPGRNLTRLAPLDTLSRIAGDGRPSAQRLVREGRVSSSAPA